eukprot:TRINITY_DN31534_c0_g1_i1.p1 TRINITY_DN31534_c0_g1~~TRINITY_DN31534_c0_g1_i1.p1  ORF type:complete len:650 (+),score=268.53 TRINITY_DN31534_c0_g1_i1:286-1950(+)
MLEQNVFIPAVGELLELLQAHHSPVSNKRAEAVANISRAVGANSASRLGKLMGHLHNPSSNVLAMEARRKAAQRLTEAGSNSSAVQPEDAYMLASSLLQDKLQMQQIMKFCQQSLHSGVDTASLRPDTLQEEGGNVGSERQRRVIDRQNKEIAMLQQQSDSLKAEVQRLHATAHQSQSHVSEEPRLHAELSLMAQEKGLLANQMGSLEATVRQERAILNQKIDSLQNSLSQLATERDTARGRAESLERENAQFSRERHLLQQQGMTLDASIQSLQQERNILTRKLEQAETKTLLLEQERAIVKQKFETIGKALSDGESEKALLKQEVDSLRDRMLAGVPDRGDSSMRDALRTEQEEARRLRFELEVLQRERTSDDAMRGDEVAGVKTENLRLRNDLDRERAMVEQAKLRERDLHTKCEMLQDATNRMTLEMEQMALTRPQTGLHEGLPTGDGMHDRITAFEMSVNRLSNEVGTVQDKIMSLPTDGVRAYSRSAGGALPVHPPQQQALQERLDTERAAFEAERNECDEIVSQMTRELELLVQENQQLKQQQHTGF